MAVGWPLGLGHDTTGWPLGLRLRLTQEDLQWPREPHLDDSPSYSTNSSSLDTEVTSSASPIPIAILPALSRALVLDRIARVHERVIFVSANR